MRTGKLSSNPGTALLQALEDLTRLRRDKQYDIDMCVWHEPRINGKCAICLAGASMAARLGVQTNEDVSPGAFPEDVERKLRAINGFRIGDVGVGLIMWGADRRWANKIHNKFFHGIGRKYLDENGDVPNYQYDYPDVVRYIKFLGRFLEREWRRRPKR